ncbi:MAG TPA: polysaccharide biosynthesis tyrosine autokinase [Gemmatimonadales bacterium]
MTSKHLPMVRKPDLPSAPPFQRGPGASVPTDDTGLDWRRIASALWQFKWVVLLATVLGIGAGVAATRVLRPIFVAQATVWIDVPSRRDDTDRRAGPIRSGSLLDSDAWIDLLKSYVVLDHVVRELRLYIELHTSEDTARFAGFGAGETFRPGDYRLRVDDDGRNYVLSTLEGRELERGVVGDSIGARIGFLWAPPAGVLAAGHTVEFSLLTLRDAARQLSDFFQVQMDLNGNFLKVELRGSSPSRIAAILNATTERYVRVAADLKRQKLTELTRILEEQLASAQRNLQDAETALRRFGVRTITLPTEREPTATSGAAPGDPVLTGFFETQVQREQMRRDREAIQRILGQAGDSGVSGDALSVIGAVAASPELSAALQELTKKQADLRAYRYKYSEEYPPVQRLGAEIAELQRRTIPSLAQALVAQLSIRETELNRRVDAASEDLRQIPPRAIEGNRLRRSLTLAEQTYNTLQARYTEAKLAAEASSVPDVRILDPAVAPQRPVKNSKPTLLLMGFLGGLGLGLAGAVLLDRLDPRVRYPEQVSQELGLAILGAVPHLRNRDAPAEVEEALRGVCLNLVHAYGAAAPLLVTITSPGPGDGKSFLAANLALTFADGGHRTLLIDGDIRRGVLHRRFDVTRQPGLTDFLLENAMREQIIQSTAYPSLHLVGCGTRTHRAPELLGSPVMGKLITLVRPDYDVILVDSPPLGAGVDPFILGTVTGNLLLVLRTGYSHREMAGAKLEVLDRLPVRTLGAVLNDVPRGSGYSYYAYYSYHLPGYETVEEGAGAAGGEEAGARPRLV